MANAARTVYTDTMINGIKSNKTYWLFALLCAGMWGSATVCIKVAYGFFGIAASDPASQLFMIGVRFMIAGVITELIFGASTGRLLVPQSKASWGHALVLTLTQVVLLYGFYSIGTGNASGTMAVMINGTSTFFTILLSTLLFRTEKMDLKKALACVIGLAAIAIMNMRGLDEALSFSVMGEGALLVSQLMAGLSNNIMKQYSATDEPATLTAWSFLFGGAVLAIIGACMGGRLSASLPGWLVLVYLAFVSGVAFSIWGLLMRYHTVSKINIFMLANPLFGVMFSALLLGEAEQVFRVRTFAALVLICAGILLVNPPKREKR